MNDRIEVDPNGLDQHAPGAKLDAHKIKAGVLLDFAYALQEVAQVGHYGATKYSRGGWQHVDNGQERYMDALVRHLLASRHEPRDTESGIHHLSHAAWNLLAVVELNKRNS